MAGTQGVRMIRRSSVARPIQQLQVHAVAGLNEIVDKAGAASDSHHVRALSTTAVNHHHRERMAFLSRNHALHKHLPLSDRAVRHLLTLHAHPEPALVGQF